jgi:hypothetical protein
VAFTFRPHSVAYDVRGGGPCAEPPRSGDPVGKHGGEKGEGRREAGRPVPIGSAANRRADGTRFRIVHPRSTAAGDAVSCLPLRMWFPLVLIAEESAFILESLVY